MTRKLVLTLAVASCLIQSTILNAQPKDRSQKPNSSTQISTGKGRRFVPPSLGDIEAPTGRRKGAASRTGLGTCSPQASNITALVPETQKNKPLGLTVAQYPTFWVFIPDLPREVSSAEFVLQDKEDRDLYRTAVDLPATSGIIGIDLPHLPEHSLAIDKSYRWTFRILCNRQNPSYNVSVDGIVMRVARNDNRYNDENIWYDILTNVAINRLAAPENIQFQDEWAELMKQISLEELTQTKLKYQDQSQLPARI